VARYRCDIGGLGGYRVPPSHLALEALPLWNGRSRHSKFFFQEGARRALV
jgi:hypothetical protein